MQKDMYYITTGFNWPEGTIISEDTFAQSPHKTFFVPEIPPAYINIPDFIARRETELSLEQYRTDMYPDNPSRANAIFLNTTIEDAIKWQNRGCRKNYNIYELSIQNEQNSCSANYIWYNYCVRLKIAPDKEFRNIFGPTPEEDFVQSIRAYWDNRPSDDEGEPTRNEILYVGTLLVTQRIA